MRLLENVRGFRNIALLLVGLLLAGILVGVTLSMVIPAKGAASTHGPSPTVQVAGAHP